MSNPPESSAWDSLTPGSDPSNSIPPTSQLTPATDDLSNLAGRYELGREIARGGMGEVFAARDRVLNRTVAIKILQAKFAGRPEVAGRFVEEAQITSQLQHPGVPPVHDLGTLPDGRPFLAMKLIKGRTLADRLKEQQASSDDSALLIRVFEEICQTVAYAHDRKVIHRDLKPANVMVGAFGEVQVMDWGLAKEVRHGQSAPRNDVDTAVLHSELRVRHTEETQAGSVMGTLAYMSPEQARAELDRVGPWSDVFSLGAILCEILTGKPPYTGPWGLVLALAELGQTEDALARLDACGAAPELVVLCKHCLAKDATERPADAGAVAKIVAAHRAGVEQRLRDAERDRATAVVKAAEQQKRRRVQLALFAALSLLVIGGGAFAWWQDRRATANALQIDSLLGQCEDALRAENAAGASVPLEQAETRMADGGAVAHRDRLARCRADRDMLRELDRIDDLRWTIISGKQTARDKAVAEWPNAFREFGIVPGETPPGEAAGRVNESLIRDRLLTALDRWLARGRSADVLAILLAADPDPYREAVRRAIQSQDDARVRELAAQPEALKQPVGFAVVLGEQKAIPTDRRERILRTAHLSRPGDLSLLMALGGLYPIDQKANAAERVRWYQAAVAVRPANSAVWTNLGVGLSNKGDPDGAIVAYKEAIRLNPNNAAATSNLGNVLRVRGKPDEAIPWYREALRIEPDFPAALNGWGAALLDKRDPDGAIARSEEALRLDPASASAWCNIGLARATKRDLDGAIAAYNEAIRLDPNIAVIHSNLGNIYFDKNEWDKAIAAHNEAVRLDPMYAAAWNNLGNVLRVKWQFNKAGECYRRAIQLDPEFASPHNGLGLVLFAIDDDEGAIQEFEKALQLNPNYALARENLDRVLYQKAVREGRIAPPPREAKAKP